MLPKCTSNDLAILKAPGPSLRAWHIDRNIVTCVLSPVASGCSTLHNTAYVSYDISNAAVPMHCNSITMSIRLLSSLCTTVNNLSITSVCTGASPYLWPGGPIHASSSLFTSREVGLDGVGAASVCAEEMESVTVFLSFSAFLRDEVVEATPVLPLSGLHDRGFSSRKAEVGTST
jgi:hypothetical protein